MTGDEKKRIRDRLREAEAEPKYVKFFDKVAFTIGVLNMGVCQYFLLNRPDLFPTWYAIIMPLILGSRYFYFKGGGLQYFMIDFCYFAIFCSLVNLLLIKNVPLLFRVCFINSTGPLTLAIPVWRNSFVFHDYDKIVSVYIHILPSMLYYTMRHLHSRFGWIGGSHVCHADNCSDLRVTDYLVALALYMFWQALYLLKTEFFDKARLDSNPELLTSLRWMAKDTKNAIARLFLKFFRALGVFKKEEEFDSRMLKTKAVFVVAQLIFTCVAFLPTPLMYYSSTFHLLYILAIITSSVFNGASFYIEVFSKRYNSHIAKIEEMDQIARAARSAMTDLQAMQEAAAGIASAKGSNQSLAPTPRRRKVGGGSSGAGSSGVDISEGGFTTTEEGTASLPGEAEGEGHVAMNGVDEQGGTDNSDGLDPQKSAENLSRLTALLQRTSDSAWLEMKALVRRTDQMRAGGVFEEEERLSEEDADRLSMGEGYAVYGTESSQDSPFSPGVASVEDPLRINTAKERSGEEDAYASENDVFGAEFSPQVRTRDNSVLSIDR